MDVKPYVMRIARVDVDSYLVDLEYPDGHNSPAEVKTLEELWPYLRSLDVVTLPLPGSKSFRFPKRPEDSKP